MTCRIVLIFSFIFYIGFYTNAQCHKYAKENALSKLSPFTPGGPPNCGMLNAGGKMRFEVTLYSGQNYRVLPAAQEVLGNVSFNLRDVEGNIIFSSKANGNAEYWDFDLESTQLIIMEVEALAVKASDEYVPRGCVALLVGFKKQSKSRKK